MSFFYNGAALRAPFIVIVLGASVLSQGVYAEPAVTPLAAAPAQADAAQPKTFKQKMEESRSLLRAGKEDDVEARFAQDAQSKPQSLDWHQEMAANLLRVAFSAQEAGDTATAQKAARRALVQYAKVEKLANGDAAILANVAELRGVIAERLLGTTVDAAREYNKSLELKGDSPSVRQKLRQAKPAQGIESDKSKK